MMMFLLNSWRGVTHAIPEPDFIIQRTLPSRIHRLGSVRLRHLGERVLVLDNLLTADGLKMLKTVFFNPEQLKPKPLLIRLLFCLFSEDISCCLKNFFKDCRYLLNIWWMRTYRPEGFLEKLVEPLKPSGRFPSFLR